MILTCTVCTATYDDKYTHCDCGTIPRERPGCTGKVRHNNRSGAKIHMKCMERAGKFGNRPYRCYQCKGWHVGKVQDPVDSNSNSG